MRLGSVDTEFFHAALRNAPEHIIVTDADLKIVYLNRTEYGYDLDQLIGSHYLQMLDPEQTAKVGQVIEQARQTGLPQRYETVVDSPTGGRRWYAGQVSWFETADGETGMIGMLSERNRQETIEQQLETLRKDLTQASHRAGMAEIATGVLHNVSNVLNSVNVSADTLIKELDGSRFHLLGRAVQMLGEHEDHLADFLTIDPKGRKLPMLLRQLDEALGAEREALRREATRLSEHLALMRSIVEAQQTIAKLGDSIEPTPPHELVERTLSMFQLDIESRLIDLQTDLPDLGKLVIDRQATLQVLANLVRNAIEALEDVEGQRILRIRLHADDDKLYFDVEDNGVGIGPEHLGRLFDHGFSTKRHGHGFGLHASAIAASAMNGTLDAHSEGPNKGARFRLTLPRITS